MFSEWYFVYLFHIVAFKLRVHIGDWVHVHYVNAAHYTSSYETEIHQYNIIIYYVCTMQLDCRFQNEMLLFNYFVLKIALNIIWILECGVINSIWGQLE